MWPRALTQGWRRMFASEDKGTVHVRDLDAVPDPGQSIWANVKIVLLPSDCSCQTSGHIGTRETGLLW